jgi:hypothetical protein
MTRIPPRAANNVTKLRCAMCDTEGPSLVGVG